MSNQFENKGVKYVNIFLGGQTCKKLLWKKKLGLSCAVPSFTKQLRSSSIYQKIESVFHSQTDLGCLQFTQKIMMLPFTTKLRLSLIYKKVLKSLEVPKKFGCVVWFWSSFCIIKIMWVAFGLVLMRKYLMWFGLFKPFLIVFFYVLIL